MILLSNAYWEIKPTPNKGRGVFAKKDISKGTIIGDYIGKIIHPQDSFVDEENFYLMYYHDRAAIAPNLQKSGVHLLNHSCLPNSWLYIYKGHTLAFSRRRIAKGEELTIPYLLSPKDKFCSPCLHICTCGHTQCSRTMHLSKEKYDTWRKLNDKWSKKTKRARIIYGKDLSLLSLYPKKIPGDYIQEVNKLFFPVELT
jgi:SET domain-containing protein